MGYFKKKQPGHVPILETPRYKGKPLLLLLENYVLDCIGCLPPDRQEKTSTAIRRIYGGGEDWKGTLRGVLELNDTVDETLRQMWRKNQQIAREANVLLQPHEFAMMVVDENFGSFFE